MKVILRSTSSQLPTGEHVVNLPVDLWQDLGWDINDVLDIELTFRQPGGSEITGVYISKKEGE